MSRAECVVYIYVGKFGQVFGKCLLACFDRFFGCGFFFVAGIVGEASGLTFFFGVKTEIFENKYFSRFEFCYGCFYSVALTIIDKFDGLSQQFRQVIDNVFERKFVFRALFRTPQVRTDNDASAISQKFFQRRQSRTHTGIVGDIQVLIERYVEIDTYKRLFTGEIEIVKCLHIV